MTLFRCTMTDGPAAAARGNGRLDALPGYQGKSNEASAAGGRCRHAGRRFACRRKDGPVHDGSYPAGSLHALAGDAAADAPHRADRPAPHQLARDGAGECLDAIEVRRMGPGQRARRSHARGVRPRLGVQVRQRRDAEPARVPAPRVAEGVDARHQRPGRRRCIRRQARIEGRPREVQGQAEGQDASSSPTRVPTSPARRPTGTARPTKRSTP